MLRRAFFPDRLVQCSLRLSDGTLVVPPWVVIRPQSPPPPCFHPHCPDETQLVTAASMLRVKAQLRIRGDHVTLDWLDRFSNRELEQR